MTRSLADLFEQLDGLDANEVALLVVLYQFADAGGTCFPSHDAIAAKLKRSRRWVLTVLKQLETVGRIKITARISKSGRTSNVYSLRDVQSLRIPCEKNDETPQSDTQSLRMNYTEESKNTPTPTREEDAPSKDVQARVVVPFGKQLVPTDWVPSAAALHWALETYPNCDIDQFTQSFVLQCQAKGYCWADPEAAWKKWLRDDHKKFLKESSHAGQPSSGRYYPSNAEQRRERMLEENRQTGDLLKARMRARRGVV